MTAQEFLKKYDLKVTFEQMYALQRKMNRMNNFTFTDEAISSDKANYLSGLKYMLSVYMTQQIQPREFSHLVSFEDFNFIDFVRDYESAMQSEFEKSGSTRDRQPFENVKNQALDIVVEQMTAFNRPAIDIWVNHIKRGARIDNLRNATIGAMQANNNPLIDSDEISLKGASPRLITFAMYKTMERVIEQRTWGWRLNPFNWGRLFEENKFMKDLKRSFDPTDLENLELNVPMLDQFRRDFVLSTGKLFYFEEFRDKVARGEAELTAEDKDVKALNDIADELNKDEDLIDADIADIDADFADIDFDPSEIDADFEGLKSDVDFFGEKDPNLYAAPSDVDDIFLVEDDVNDAKEIEAAFADKVNDPNNIIARDDVIEDIDQRNKEFEKKLEREIARKEAQEKFAKLSSQPKPNTFKNALDMMRSKAIMNIMLDVFANTLENSGKSAGDNFKTARTLYQNLVMDIKSTWSFTENMPQHATNMFKKTYLIINTNAPKMGVSDKLVAAQKITDAVLNTYSPVGSNPKYAQYGDNYGIKRLDDDSIKSLTGYEGNVSELISNVKSELGIIKETVNFVNGEFNENAVDKAEKIEEHSAPVQSKVKE